MGSRVCVDLEPAPPPLLDMLWVSETLGFLSQRALSLPLG